VRDRPPTKLREFHAQRKFKGAVKAVMAINAMKTAV
jgi:hypothetical protein